MNKFRTQTPCGCRERERESSILVNFGAKEEVESTKRVAILPRDCE